VLLFVLAFVLSLAALLDAQTPPSSPVLQIPPAAQARPEFDPEAATRAYLATLGPEQKARSDAYFEGGNWLIPRGLSLRSGRLDTSAVDAFFGSHA